MYEDKCPTCPKYGTGQYCDCGSSKMEPIRTLAFLITMVLCLAGLVAIVLFK
jgi:hypothetical protein